MPAQPSLLLAACRTRSRSGSSTPRGRSAFAWSASAGRGSSPPRRGRPSPRSARSRCADRPLAHEARRARRHHDRACRPVDDHGVGRQAVQRCGGVDRVPDPVHRAERAERSVDDDAVDGDQLPLPAEHPRRAAGAERQGRAAVPARQHLPVHRRRRGRVVARGRSGRRHRPRGLLQRAVGDAPGDRPRLAPDADDDAERDRGIHGDRHSRLEARHGPRLPVRPGRGRARAAPALGEVVPVHEALHARREAGRVRVRDRDGVVVGVGDVQHGRGRPGQVRGRLRVPVGPRRLAVRRAWGRRPGVRRLSRRGPARGDPCRSPVHARRPVAPPDRPLAA